MSSLCRRRSTIKLYKGLFSTSPNTYISCRWNEYGLSKHFSSVHCPTKGVTSSILSKTRDPISNSSLISSQTHKNLVALNVGGIRFASTSPSASPQSPIEPPSIPASKFSTELLSVDGIDEKARLSAEALLHAPESIGYLKSIGLDWGWGPTSILEYIMEHIHVYMGTPWWATIVITSVLIRAALFKPYLISAENATKLAIVNPISKPVIDKMMAAQRAGDQAAFFQYKQEQTLIYKRAGIKTWKSGIPLIQMVLGFATFRLLNGMARLPVPGLESGGTLWFSNLSIPDPLYILPLATAATLHWVMKKGGETGVQVMNPKMLVIMKWGFPLISVIFTSWLPASVQLTFFMSGILSLAQASLLRQPWLRSYFQMTPLPNSDGNKLNSTKNVYNGQMRIAESHVLSQAELSQRFQPPMPHVTVKPNGLDSVEPKAESAWKGNLKQIISGAVTDIKGTVKEVVESGRNLAGQSKEELKGRLGKAEIRQRELYEKKKQEEERLARLEEQRLRRAERNKRKHLVK